MHETKIIAYVHPGLGDDDKRHLSARDERVAAALARALLAEFDGRPLGAIFTAQTDFAFETGGILQQAFSEAHGGTLIPLFQDRNLGPAHPKHRDETARFSRKSFPGFVRGQRELEEQSIICVPHARFIKAEIAYRTGEVVRSDFGWGQAISLEYPLRHKWRSGPGSGGRRRGRVEGQNVQYTNDVHLLHYSRDG